MYEDLQWVCVGVFTLSIPLLVIARFRIPECPAWVPMVTATALGWVLANAWVGLEHLDVAAAQREEAVALQDALRNPPAPERQPDGSEVIWDPGISEFFLASYRPGEALGYGPAYLAGCWFAAWLYFRRCSAPSRRRLLLLSGGILAGLWIVVAGYRIDPPALFLDDDWFAYRWHLFFGPQLSLPAAVVIAWLIDAAISRVLPPTSRTSHAD